MEAEKGDEFGAVINMASWIKFQFRKLIRKYQIDPSFQTIQTYGFIEISDDIVTLSRLFF